MPRGTGAGRRIWRRRRRIRQDLLRRRTRDSGAGHGKAGPLPSKLALGRGHQSRNEEIRFWRTETGDEIVTRPGGAIRATASIVSADDVVEIRGIRIEIELNLIERRFARG